MQTKIATYNEPKTWALEQQAVDSRWNGYGIAEALTDHAEKIAKENGAEWIAGNAAIDNMPICRLYENR